VTEDPRYTWAHWYIRRGWPVFVLGRMKTPLPNCADCRVADFTHDREACTCLHCHGFYAATLNYDRVDDMIRTGGPGLLAVRTGRASGLVVLDFEALDKDAEGVTGLEVAEQWNVWTGLWLPPTLQARSGAGGLHMYYRYPPSGLRSRPRVLPNTDLKSDGGYVAVPCGVDGRVWRGLDAIEPADLGPELVRWLGERRHHARRGHGEVFPDRPGGYSFDRCLREGPEPGERDHFFNELIFRRRKARWDQERTLAELAEVHALMTQRDDDAFPWAWLEYKVERVWQLVRPDDLADGARAWLSRATAAVGSEPTAADTGPPAEVSSPSRGKRTYVTRERKFTA
jgi:bifunctional DNA primase/polymerase-like protein